MKNIVASGKLYNEFITLKQINKTKARNLFAKGETIYLQSSNMMPFNPWQSVCPVQLDKSRLKSAKEHYEWCVKYGMMFPVHTPDANGQFEEVIGNFSYYNLDNERGRYIHFYIKIK